jgi:hypothetical protein
MRSLSLVCCLFLLAIAGDGQTNPVPSVNLPLIPESVAPRSGGFILTVNGTGFEPGAVVKWNGSTRKTHFESSSQLKAAINSHDVSQPGTARVTVVNPAPGGGSSNVVDFVIRTALPQVTFRPPSTLRTLEPGSAVAADFNGDGKVDIAIGNACGGDDTCAGTIDVYLGHGDGTFAPPIRSVAVGAALTDGGGLFVADFNGDGQPDIAISLHAGDGMDPPFGYVLLGNEDGTFTQGLGSYGGIPQAVGDLNGDGLPDVITTFLTVDGPPCAITTAFLGNPDGTYTDSAEFYYMGATGATLGDFNHDGILDLAMNGASAAACNHTGTSVALGNGDGTFQTPVQYDPVNYPSHIQAIDLNGDGNLDLLTDGVCALFGNGDGTFTQGSCTAEAGSYSMSVADFNGDGNPDVALFSQKQDGTYDISLYLGNGDGTFGRPVVYPMPDITSSYEGAAPGDLNNDGGIDFVLSGNSFKPLRTDSAVFLQVLQSILPER